MKPEKRARAPPGLMCVRIIKAMVEAYGQVESALVLVHERRAKHNRRHAMKTKTELKSGAGPFFDEAG